MSTQAALPIYGQDVPAKRLHKAQRQTAREVYRRKRADDIQKAATGKETREGQVLRILAWHWNERQSSPTALELLDWARAKGERLFDVNSLRPRIFSLVQQGLVRPCAKRKCQVSGQTVFTWKVREIGDLEPR